MGVVAELGRLAVGALSPGGAGGGFIASGTYASDSDGSFGSPATLEIISVDLQRSKLIPVTDVPTSDKFCSIDWGLPSRQHQAGLIAGGLADGTVRVWDAATLLRPGRGKGDESTAVLIGGGSAQKKHAGAVRALAFNPFASTQTKLATGGADGQVLVWDLANAAAGPVVRPPAGQPTAASTAPKEQVTAVAWNRKLQTILGTGTSSGFLNVWDLKQSKQVIGIRNPRGRLRCSSLAWHPDISTQIIIACDQDESTGAVLYDLRNASAPIMAYTHHGSRGVSSMSWCPHDSDLLLTSSQDSRTVVVSVSSGEIVSEAAPSANWNFDVKWSSRMPGLYLSSAMDGRITVNSMMTATTAPSVSSETASALAESFGEMAGGFQSSAMPQSPTVEKARVSYNLNRAPKWFRKPVSISFGFGGSYASITGKESGQVRIDSLPESFEGLKESSVKLDEMLMDLVADDPSAALRWCGEQSAAAETPKDKMAWDALGIMFQTGSRRAMLKYLDYELPPMDAGDDIAIPVYGLARSAPLAVPVRPAPAISADISDNKADRLDDVDHVANGASAMNLDGPAPWEVSDATGDSANLKDSILDGDDTANDAGDVVSNKPNGISVPGDEKKSKVLAGKTREQVDALVKKSVIVGDFKTAVEACLHVGRTADALIIAHAGGPDLWLHTQAEYISSASVSKDSKIVGAIAGPKGKMDAYISDAAEAGKDSWKEALAVILTYSSTEDILESCSALGQRLLMTNNDAEALLCFICAGNTRMATSVWMQDRISNSKSISAMMADRIERLGVLVQRVRLLTAASALAAGEREIGMVKALDDVSGSILCEYGALLTAQGDASLAVTYLSNLDPSYTCVYGSAEVLRDRAAESFTMADSAAAAPVVASGADQSDYGAYGQSYNHIYGYTGHTYGADAQGYGAAPAAPAPGNWNSQYDPPQAADVQQPYQSAVQPPAPPSAPTASPPRPSNVFASNAPTAERSAYDPSAAYAAAPAYGQGSYPSPPQPPVPVNATDPSTMVPSVVSPVATPPSMPAAPPPPMPMNLGSGPANLAPPTPAMPYGTQQQSNPYGGNLGIQSQPLAPPPPPPPVDDSAPLPSSYHAKAKPGSGAALPPSAEVAVAEGRRAKPVSSSGTPDGPPRRSGSTSSSLGALGVETIFLEKADVSKVPANQQVIVKSLRGSYMYALSLNQTLRYKKKMDDVSKRLGRLVGGLNAGLVEATVVDLLVEVARFIEKGNYDGASVVVQTLTKQHWDANSQWIQGLKRLIDCVLTGR